MNSKDQMSSPAIDTYSELERLHAAERKLVGVIKWLEKNEPSVFRRGIWEAIAETALCETTRHGN